MKKQILSIALTPWLADLSKFDVDVEQINVGAQKLSAALGMSVEECKKIILDGMKVIIKKGCTPGPSITLTPPEMYCEKLATYETSMTPKEYGQSLQKRKKR